MRNKTIYPLIVFISVFFLHAIYSIWKSSQVSQQWFQIENMSSLSLYFKQQDFFLGFAYALAGGFTIYALLKFLQNRKSGVGGIIGGITLTGILYIGGCFLLGCCGSPMLAVYLSLFGSSFLGFTKPFIAIITTISVTVGYFWIARKGKKCYGANEMEINLKSVIICPGCGFKKEEIMPTDSCVIFYQCTNCKKILKPKEGDCCVFCSYGSVKCPPKQKECCS